MRDFTLHTYRSMLLALRDAGYRFVTFETFLTQRPNEPFVILRHDVDLRAANSLEVARIEASLGIQASYYFRVVPQSNQPNIIRQIVALGHEVGYHYEDMSICRGDTEKAMVHFRKKLAYFRSFYPVKTICMHGAPMSKYDGRKLWETYDYRGEGILGEPYFDVDFGSMLYLTDTGRCWDGYKVSVRDKIEGHQDTWNQQGLCYHRTADILSALQDNNSPLRSLSPSIMITTHPQRWTDDKWLWTKELVMQTIKNWVKRMLIILR